MKNSIKYNELSRQIKAEIEKYYEKEKIKNENLKKQDALLGWFDRYFDKWMKKNYGDKKDDRRKYFRLNIEIPVSIIKTIIESTKDETLAIDLMGTITNISRGGLFFTSKKYIETSSIIKVKIDLRSVDKNLKDIEALAMVTRCEKDSKDEYGIGLMFSSIYDEDKENFDVFIFRNIAHYIYL